MAEGMTHEQFQQLHYPCQLRIVENPIEVCHTYNRIYESTFILDDSAIEDAKQNQWLVWAHTSEAGATTSFWNDSNFLHWSTNTEHARWRSPYWLFCLPRASRESAANRRLGCRR